MNILEQIRHLMPHSATPKTEILEESPPRILMSWNAYRDTHFIIEAAGSDEIAWLGSIKVLENNQYLIDKVFLFEQQVSAGHCEFDQEDIGRFYHEVLQGEPDGRELLSSILFWGHVHPGNMTEPSHQDEEQMQLFNHNPYFIRGIFTRGGKCVFTFFDYQRNLKITDCPWDVYLGGESRREEIAALVQQKVSNRFPFQTRIGESSPCPQPLQPTSTTGGNSTSSRQRLSRKKSR